LGGHTPPSDSPRENVQKLPMNAFWGLRQGFLPSKSVIRRRKLLAGGAGLHELGETKTERGRGGDPREGLRGKNCGELPAYTY
jgi:hypothetical protein